LVACCFLPVYYPLSPVRRTLIASYLKDHPRQVPLNQGVRLAPCPDLSTYLFTRDYKISLIPVTTISPMTGSSPGLLLLHRGQSTSSFGFPTHPPLPTDPQTLSPPPEHITILFFGCWRQFYEGLSEFRPHSPFSLTALPP